MLTDAQIDQLVAAVQSGQLTEEQATAMAREALFAAGAAATTPATTPPPAHGKPWQSLYEAPKLADRQIVEAHLRRQGLSQLEVANGLIEALETRYEGYQDVIKDTRANAQAQAEQAAEQKWLTTTEGGRAERERRINDEAAAIVQAKTDHATKAEAARIILTEKHGLTNLDQLSDDEAIETVYGVPEEDLSNNLAANVAAANAQTQAQEGGTQ